MNRQLFILGMTRRTGTNFAFRLLALHPHVRPAAGLLEDFTLHEADLLVEYVRRTKANWNPGWDVRPGVEARLLRRLGEGITAFLAEECRTDGTPDTGLAVYKTPSVRNLENFFDLFPNASLLVLIRDVRDVAESAVRSFAYSYAEILQEWCEAAAVVTDFRARHEGRRNYQIVRYEDLVADTGTVLKTLLSWQGLDARLYDFDAARSLPVYGSSTFRGGRRDLHWRPVPKDETFNPIGRWQNWPAERRREFERAAGQLMKELGYPGVDW